MNSEQFVDLVKRDVISTSVSDTTLNLHDPPGRRISAEERARSNWFNQLQPEERSYIESALRDAAHGAIFGLFALLDRSRPIDDGSFELVHVNGETRTVLNDPSSIGLNELLNATD